jgi:hypothetical protein
VVDGTGLENRHTRKGIGGSNPSLSASYFCYLGLTEAPATHSYLEEPLRKVKVNLTKYVATVAGLRHCPAVITSNGRIKQDIVVVNGQE